MHMSGSLFLLIGGVFSAVAAVLHIGCILVGAPGYRFFGAGEEMAQLAEKGSPVPAIVTSVIVCVLIVWSVFAFSGAGVIAALPLLKPVLVLLTAVYLLRGLVGLYFVRLRIEGRTILDNSPTFWLWSSVICLVVGAIHLAGLAALFSRVL